MKKNPEPEQIHLTAEEVEALKVRISEKNLSDHDIKIMLGLVSFSFWIQNQLALAKLSIRKLKRLFGFRTEKKTLKIPKVPQ